MNTFQRTVMRNFAGGVHAAIAKIEDHEEALEMVARTDDFLFQDVINNLADVTSNEEARNVLRSTIENNKPYEPAGMAA